MTARTTPIPFLCRDDSGAPDRTPPQDLEAERSVLGGMMISKDAIADVVEQLRGSDFYRPAHEAIVDTTLIPRLDDAIAAALRLVVLNERSLKMTVTFGASSGNDPSGSCTVS